ncbi:anthranilate phosphoribosyltransferase [bacterium]|nr:anthranilate phosphoribosyltransferase [bacterium]
MKKIINKAFAGNKLSCEDIEQLVSAINNETVSSEQVAAILGAISARSYQNGSKTEHGATPEEISDFAKALKKYSKEINLKCDKGFIDVCGTGGDCLGTFNISTTVSFVIASLGAKVAKHGSRAVSSKSGSADVLEKLGINIELSEDKLQKVLDETGMVFLFAPHYNLGMAKIKKIRNSIGVPTIFNLLGPLINPVKLDYQVIGVYDKSKCELIAQSLKHIGVKKAMVVHGNDGLDELSTTCDNTVYYLSDNNVTKLEMPSYKDFGIPKANINEIKGGNSEENAQIILDILNGKKGAKRDIVLLNSAAALIVAGIAKDFYDGIEKAAKAIDDGLALNVLERLKNVSR